MPVLKKVGHFFGKKKCVCRQSKLFIRFKKIKFSIRYFKIQKPELFEYIYD